MPLSQGDDAHWTPMIRRSGVLAAVLAVLFVLTACSGGGGSRTYTFQGATKLGSLIPVADRKPAGDVRAPLLDGHGDFRLSGDKGKVVLLNFWATWCPPCRVEAPQLDNVYRAYKAKDVLIVGVDTKDFPRSKPESFVSDNQITYPIVFDEQGESIVTLGSIPGSLPFSVLVDRQGRVAAVYIGPVTPKDLSPVLDQLRAET
jgi:thiol-disulfide isomerase/thioredoxin